MLSKGSHQNERVITFGKKKKETQDNSIQLHYFRQIEGEKMDVVTDFLFGALISLQMVTAAMKSEDNCFLTGKL